MDGLLAGGLLTLAELHGPKKEMCTSRKSIERDGTSQPISSHLIVLGHLPTSPASVLKTLDEWRAELQNNRLIAYAWKELADKETIDRLQSEINPYHDLPRYLPYISVRGRTDF